MIASFSSLAQQTGHGAGLLLVGLLCAAGLALSCLSLSGTWLVTAAAVLDAWLSGAKFPGWGLVILFLLLSAGVEVVEALSGTWGVKRRGGSGAAGRAALIGGLLGLVAGTVIPIPILGSLVGMILGSFLLAYVVERMRLKKSSPALHIAFGAVIARLVVLVLKVSITLGMILTLFVGGLVT